MVASDLIDLRRLARAVHLDVRRLADHQYEVTGGSRRHLVDLGASIECDCPDRGYRHVVCSHLLAAMLAEGDRDCLRTLRVWVPRP